MTNAAPFPSLHQRAISSLAQESNCTIDEVTALYTREFEKLAVDARVRDFLPILAARHVKSSLRERERSTTEVPELVSA